MSKHVNAIGVLRLALAGIGAMLVITVYFGSRWLITFPPVIEDPMAESVLITVGNAIVVVVGIGSALNILAAVGLLTFQPWARYLTIFLSIFDLFNIPVGTAVALYTLWVLMQNEVVTRFGGHIDMAYPPDKLARQS